MTEFKITIEAAALTEAINNLATAIGSAGRSAETAPAITSASKKRTKALASAPAPAESAAAPAPVNPAIPAAPTAPAAGTFVPGAPQANPAAAVPTNAQPFAPCVPGTPGVPTAPAVPAAPVGYTLSQLSNAGATLVEQGKMNELMALLGRYGVAAITQLAPAQYPAIAAELIAMGATLYQKTTYLTITLPSGRKLFYVNPSLGQNRWGEPSITYMGVDQTSKSWSKIETYGGKLTENVVQAIARDCLAEAIEHLEAAGFPIAFHVHDEVVIDIKPYADNATMLEHVKNIMVQPPSWAPDLPLGADGWVGAFFRKD